MNASSSPARRILRWVLFGLGGLVALVIAAAVVFVLTFNINHYKPRIIAAVRQSTGRTLILNGPIAIKLSLHPTIEATDVALANPPGFSRPDTMRLAALDVQLGLRALLHGKVAIGRLVLIRPDVLLERSRTGAVNWQFTPAATPPGAPGAPSAAGAPPGPAPGPAPAGPAAPAPPAGSGVSIQDLRIEDGTIAYRDDATGKQTTVALRAASLHAAGPAAPLQLNATATVNGTKVTLAGTTGSLAALERPASGHPPSVPWPVRLVLTAADAQLAANGTIADPAAGRGVALGFDLKVPDLATLGTLAGTALPPVRQIALTGKLVAPGTIAQGASLQDFALTLPQGQLAGTLGLRFGAVPALSGTLRSPSLDADALLAELHAPAAPGRPAATAPAATAPASTAPAAARPAPAGPAAPRSDLLIPNTPLPFALLRRADADLSVAITALRSGGETWRDLAFHLVLSGGKLTVAPFTATPPAGKLSLRLTVDATQPAPPVTFTLHAPGLALASVLALAGQKGLARGDMAIEANLHGAGTSPHAIAAGLGGVLSATMTGGAIDNAVVNRLFGGVLAKANLPALVAHGGTSDIRCLAVRLVATGGVARLDPFLFSSTLETISGDGTVNLGPETLALLLHPQGRVGGTGFSLPVQVSGRFAHPVVTLSSNGAAKAGIGAALSFLGGKKLAVPQALQANGPSCASALAQARGQPAPATAPTGAGPAGAAPAGKPAAPSVPNPANLLQKLFR